MRIVSYVNAYPGMGRNAGAETALHEMLRFLVMNGWEADVVVSQPFPGMTDYVIDGVNVHPIADKRTILHWLPRGDIVATQLDDTERVVLLCKKYRIPVIQLIHNTMGPTHRYVGMGSDLFVFNTEWVMDEFTFDGLSCVIHPPVSASGYAFSEHDPKYVTLVNIWPDKGSDVFYKLAERMPDVEFLGVLGGYGVQDIREGYPNITFHPNTPDMANIFRQTRVVIMPSKYESYGRVAVEAASQGIPSVVCPTPGLLEAMGPDGLYAQTAGQFEQAIKRLKHWKAYKSASTRVKERFAYLDSLREPELNHFMTVITGIAETGKILRGW